MSIYLDAARAILSLPQESDSWNEYIVKNENHDAFIWTDEVEDECHEFWNAMFTGDEGDLEEVELDVVEDDEEDYPNCYYRYKGQTIEIPLVHDREDNSIMIHTLNQLVKADTEFRFCRDSSGSSDLAFLVLPTNDWASLEAEFGQELVDIRFLKFPNDVDEFLEAIFSDEYNEFESESSPEDLAYEDIEQAILPAVEACVESVTVHIFSFGSQIIVGLLTDTDAEMNILKNNEALQKKVSEIASAKCEEHELCFQEFDYQSQETIDRENIELWMPKNLGKGFDLFKFASGE